MKKIMIIILVLILALTGCTNIETSSVEETISQSIEESTMDYEVLFEEGIVHEIYIDIVDENWDYMMENPLEEEFVEADITVDGYTVENIAIRTKGNSTLRDVSNSDSDRYSFKIKVDEYEDQKLLGLDEFVLNNMYSDSSYMREYLSYQAFEGVDEIASLTSYINVYVNGELYGLYLMVETVEDGFLNRTFGENDGNLYRMDQGSTLLDNTGNASQKNGDDESQDDLNAFIEILNAMPQGEKGDIESVLDVESALKYIAGNTVMSSYDSYNGQFAQNYYLYNHEGIFYVIPWDYNMSFGTFNGTGTSTIDIDEPVNGVTMDSVPLIDNLLAVDEYKEIYYDILEDYIDYFDDFEDQVAEIRTLITDHVENDPTKFSSFENFELSTVYQEDGADESTMMGGMQGGRGEMRERPTGQPPADGQQPPTDVQEIDKNQAGFPPTQGDNPMGMGDKMGMGNSTMAGDDTSIINILKARIENINEQLNQ